MFQERQTENLVCTGLRQATPFRVGCLHPFAGPLLNSSHTARFGLPLRCAKCAIHLGHHRGRVLLARCAPELPNCILQEGWRA
eukprot:571955-Prymnesium_polylepis.2